MAEDFEGGLQGMELTPGFKKLQELIMNHELRVGGDVPIDPDNGELARLAPRDTPPEESGAEVQPSRDLTAWAGTMAVANA